MAMRRGLFTFLSVAFCVLWAGGYLGESLGAPYYEGKRITIVVGVGPGGGYDRMARLFAKHLPKYIPGKPTMVVQNMEGAASILASNHVFNLAKADGLTLGAIQRGIPIAQLLKVDGVRYDIMKYAWVGSTATEATVLALRTDLPFKTFEDLLKFKGEINLGGTGLGESSTQFAILLKQFAGLNLKMIFYPSSPDIMLAIERKEVDGRPGSYSAIKPFIERGLVRPLMRSRVSESGIENLPTDEDYASDAKGKTIMAMRSAGELIGRPYVAPPGTPPEIMSILRTGFEKAALDPELLAEAKKNMLEVRYVPADECLKVVQFIFNQPDDVVKEFQKYIKF